MKIIAVLFFAMTMVLFLLPACDETYRPVVRPKKVCPRSCQTEEGDLVRYCIDGYAYVGRTDGNMTQVFRQGVFGLKPEHCYCPCENEP